MTQNSTQPQKDSARPHMIIGWREQISLPDLGLNMFAVKIDTGARTTALHAVDVETYEQNGVLRVRFSTDAIHGQPKHCDQPIHDTREITNTSGVPEARLIIRTRLLIAGRKWSIDVSLADRAPMRYPLILGRSALKGHNISVNPGRSYLISPKPEPEG